MCRDIASAIATETVKRLNPLTGSNCGVSGNNCDLDDDGDNVSQSPNRVQLRCVFSAFAEGIADLKCLNPLTGSNCGVSLSCALRVDGTVYCLNPLTGSNCGVSCAI